MQSVYLSLITLLSLLFLNGGFLTFTEKSGSLIRVAFNGIFRDNAGQNLEFIEKLLPLSVLIILIPILSLIAIFIFRNRKIQMKVVLILIILSIVLVIALILVSFRIISKFDATIIPGIKMILPVLILIISILAYRGIRKDDQLVKSYDRLR
jgi:4-amino-4-deoxy-L-arabinose transferase-like glycosyltransferase